MTRLDDLPPDERAVLSLLVRQGRSYAEVATLLGIREEAVHDRARSALAELAGGAALDGGASELTVERREEIGDYLLGQQASVGQRLRTRSFLERSDAGRAWANAVSAELGPLASAPLPEIPEEPQQGNAQPPRATTQPERGAPEPTAEELEQDAAASRVAGHPGSATPRPLPSSRMGGALLLAAVVAVVVVAILLLSGGGSSKHTPTTAASSHNAGSGTATSTSTAATASEDNRITLTPTEPGSKAIGVAEILSEGNKYAFYLAAEHLPPSNGFFYAVWLYNNPSSHEPLSKSPPVTSNGRLQGGALLPANAGEFHEMLLTKETSERPTAPGPVVLSGPFSLHG